MGERLKYIVKEKEKIDVHKRKRDEVVKNHNIVKEKVGVSAIQLVGSSYAERLRDGGGQVEKQLKLATGAATRLEDQGGEPDRRARSRKKNMLLDDSGIP